MKEDKAYIVRKILTVVSLILIFATAGLLAITTQLKTITFNYYGDIKSIKTLASSVDGFLFQNKIYLSEDTLLEPSKNARLTNGMTITVYSNSEETFDIESVRESYSPIIASVKEEIQAIPFDEETVNNEEVDSGTTQVLKEGVEGSKSISYIVKSTNNEIIQKDEIGTEILAEAQNRVVEVGTKVTVSRSSIVTSISSQPVDGGFVQYNISLPVEYQKYAYNLCVRYGIDYPLFLSIMYCESRYDPNAGNPAYGYSNTYARGLCQIAYINFMNLNAKLGITDLYDPYDNMTAGAYLFSVYTGIASSRVSDTNSIVTYALGAYNMGEGAYYNNIYSQGRLSTNYTDKVLQTRERLIANGGLY